VDLQMLHSQVLVRPYVVTRYNTGVLVTSEDRTDKMHPQQGNVISIGKDVTMLGVGDTVIYGRSVGRRVYLNDEPLLVMQESDIIGEIE